MATRKAKLGTIDREPIRSAIDDVNSPERMRLVLGVFGRMFIVCKGHDRDAFSGLNAGDEKLDELARAFGVPRGALVLTLNRLRWPTTISPDDIEELMERNLWGAMKDAWDNEPWLSEEA